MAIKIIVLLLFLVIFYSLGSALFFMLSKRKDPKAMVKALTWRIGLSILVFLLLIIGVYLGWVEPNNSL